MVPIARVGIVTLAFFGAFAQSAPAPAAFEVASIKRIQITGPVPGMTRETGPGSLTMRNASLGFCIRWAYDLEPYQIVGPAWIDPPTEFRFDILAKAGRPVRDDELKLMLRTLLAERFKLALHREKRDLPVYALVVSKNGAKLRPAGVRGGERTEAGRQAFSDHLSKHVNGMAGRNDEPALDVTTGRGSDRPPGWVRFYFGFRTLHLGQRNRQTLARRDGPRRHGERRDEGPPGAVGTAPGARKSSSRSPGDRPSGEVSHRELRSAPVHSR